MNIQKLKTWWLLAALWAVCMQPALAVRGSTARMWLDVMDEQGQVLFAVSRSTAPRVLSVCAGLLYGTEPPTGVDVYLFIVRPDQLVIGVSPDPVEPRYVFSPSPWGRFATVRPPAFADVQTDCAGAMASLNPVPRPLRLQYALQPEDALGEYVLKIVLVAPGVAVENPLNWIADYTQTLVVVE